MCETTIYNGNFGRRQRGFALPIVIFMVVTVAAILAAMMRLQNAQSSTVDLMLLKARADLAVQSAAEWASHRVNVTKACPANVPPFPGFTLSVLRCDVSSFTESGTVSDRFDITLEAATTGLARNNENFASSRLDMTFVVVR